METVFFARFSQPFREFMFSHFEPERPTNMISLDSCIFACFMTLHKYTPFTNSQAPSEKEKIKYRTREHRVCVCVISSEFYRGKNNPILRCVAITISLVLLCCGLLVLLLVRNCSFIFEIASIVFSSIVLCHRSFVQSDGVW